MYQNLIKSLKTILSSKSTQAEKLLKISTLVDFADGLGGVAPKPTQPTIPTPTPTPTPAGQTLFLNEFDCGNKKIEIYNAGDAEVDMTGWTLSKDDTEWEIPAAHAKVPAKGYIVYIGKSDGTTDPTFGLSGTKGFIVVLKDKDGKEIDKVDNSAEREGGIVVIEDGKSWGRKTDGADEWVLFSVPSIGESNSKGTIE